MADKKMYKVGLTVKEPWSPDISYEVLDITLFAVESGGDGCSYTAIKPNQGVTPGTDDTVWVKSTQAGQSIYDLAVKYHHFVGTEEEFEQQYQDALDAANNAAAAASATDEEIKANELSRVSAENGRVAAEQSRVSAEQSRVGAESARVSAESARVSAESSRESAEATRASNESARVTAENSRVSAESARVTAEQSRLQQFEALKTDMETAIDNVDAKAAEIEEDIEGYEANEAARVTAERSRVSAESSRVSAESARVTAENARVAQASSDHTRAETDHGTAASDHTTAQADHTQAVSDHNTAVSDHDDVIDVTQSAISATSGADMAADAANLAAQAATEAAETIDAKIATKQDVIADLTQIREGATDTVKYTSQSLTDAQKEQARANIGAASEEDLADKADKDGYYGGMTVGASENLVGRGTTDAEYAGVRTSAGTADIGSGSATIARMRGRSFKWNQLVEDTVKDLTYEGAHTSYDPLTHLVCVENVSRETQYSSGSTQIILSNVKIISGHKYIALSDCAINGIGLYFYLSSYQYVQFNTIYTATADGTSINLRLTNQLDFPNDLPIGSKTYFHVQIHDLTVIFGAGNEPSTMEEFEAWRKEMGLTLDYYASNPGEVINNRAAAIETVGFNLYDHSTGKAFLPGVYSSYPHEYEICGTFESISFTDVNGNESVPVLTDGRFFNVSAPGELTVVGGNNTDTLVHLVWSGWRNEGEPDYAYEPYWKNTLNLGLTTLKGKLNGTGDSVVIFPNGLAKIGDMRDEIVGNKAIKRIGVVFLADVTGSSLRKSTVSGVDYFVFDGVALTGYNNLLCSKYPTYTGNNTLPSEGCISNKIATGKNTVWIKDSNYSDVASFKAAMSGIPLYYELATPQEYTLDEPMPSQYRVDDFGTERVIPSYSPSELTAPIAYDVQYAMNAVDAIRRLDDNYVNESQIKQTAGRSETDVYSQKGVDDHYAKKVGLEENLVSGLSRNLAGKDVQTGEFATAVISGADGLAKINEVMGRSLVWNQLINDMNSSADWASYNTSGVLNSDGSVTVTNTGNGCWWPKSGSQDTRYILLVGHKYLVRATVKRDSGEEDFNVRIGQISGNGGGRQYYVLNVPITPSYETYSLITPAFTVSSNYGAFGIGFNDIGTGNVITVKNYMFIDLTQLFGLGNEPSTVAEFESWLANNIGYRDYYAYNPGEIISNNTEKLEITGLNQFDGTYGVENSYLDANGNPQASSIYNITDYMPVLPNMSYYVKDFFVVDASAPRLCWYDAEKNFISAKSYTSSLIYTSPSNAAYIRLSIARAQVSTACLSVSGSRNGEYEPYQKSELELNLATITGKLNGEGESVTIFPDGMRSAGTAFDSLIVDEDGWCRRAVRRLAEVDMGTLNWHIIANNSYRFGIAYNDIPEGNVKLSASDTQAGNVLCEKYPTYKRSALSDGSFGIALGRFTNEAVVIYDPAYTTAADAPALITSLSGVSLIYELSTPLEYVLDTPIQMTFQAKHGGVIRQLPENGSAPTTAPMRMSVTYALDAVSILSDLPENYVSKESLQAMLSAMQSAGLFSAYTMTFNESTGKYEFTFTANA